MYYKEWLSVRRVLFWFAVLVPASWLTYAVVAFMTHTTNDLMLDSWKQLLSWAVTLGAVAATIFGSSLARERDGHLEIACTRPISRLRYATRTMIVDVAGVAGVFLITVLAVYGTLSVLAGHPLRLQTGTESAWQLVRYCAAPLAWFGLTQAVTARLRCQTASMVAALAWPVAVIVAVLAIVPIAPGLHQVFSLINAFNPIAASTMIQIDIGTSSASATAVAAASNVGLSALALLAFAVGGPLVAALQWRRVEA
jgi:hypothetical protein